MEPPAHTRALFDPIRLRHMIFDTAKESLHKKLNEIESSEHKLQVRNLTLDTPKFSATQQKKAILEKKDLTVALKGTVDLIHKPTGKVLESKETTLAHLPYMTSHNTVIYNGSEYEALNQQRLLPGVYHRIRQDGLAEAHINPEARTGQSCRILFLPDKQLFLVMVKSSQVKLYGLLKDMGVQDSVIKAAWGEQIYNANRAAYDGREIDKFYGLLFKE